MVKWYLVQTKARQEARAITNLQRQGFDTYCPVATQKTLSNKTEAAAQPLFPAYIFVCFEPKVQSSAPIRSTLGVIGLVRFGTQLAMVNDALIEQLRKDEKKSYAYTPQKFDPVNIDQTCFRHLKAVYDEPDGEKRSFLLIELLGQQQRISIKNDAIVVKGK